MRYVTAISWHPSMPGVQLPSEKRMSRKGKAQQEAYYTCFDIMQKYGLGKTQVRRFAETHGVRIKKAKGGRANLYLKADWEAARKKAEKTSANTKAKRS